MPGGKNQRLRGGKAAMESKTSIASIMKDIEILGSSRMTWKEKKELENRKVVALGGKPPKKHRLPLSVAKVPMKRQKAREQRMLQENAILSRFGAKFSSSSNLDRPEEKHKPEQRALKSTQGFFKNGVLDVKHLMRPDPVSGSSQEVVRTHHGKGKKKGGKKNKGRKGSKN
ncbi:hypothetical protein MLD38_003429 [Melastoma candidum]|uniref:Uncharacterized protein n=1 Tax=Melastoma candidum TaxID=119954 RepID=A0ACB9S746_9MYRT|nr:hypothetical protein MLD38_003429 [Melastoma candidum]